MFFERAATERSRKLLLACGMAVWPKFRNKDGMGWGGEGQNPEAYSHIFMCSPAMRSPQERGTIRVHPTLMIRELC